MEEAGQPAPEYRQNEFMVYATIRQRGDVIGQLNGELNGELNASQKATLQFIIEHEGCTASENQGDRNFYTRFYVPEKCV